MRKIFVLEAKGKGIRDLTGLEKCTNLQLLDLTNNAVANLAALKPHQAGIGQIEE